MTQRSYSGSRPSLGESLALIIYNGLSPDDFSAESQRQVAALRPSIGSRYDHFQHPYRDAPAAFIHDCVDWEGGSPADYQTDIAERLISKRRVAVRASHAVGKTTTAAIVILWFALTRDGDDWKIPCTASALRQLSKYLWPEIHQGAWPLPWARHGPAAIRSAHRIAHTQPPAGDWRGVRAGLRRSRKHGRCARRPFDVRIR